MTGKRRSISVVLPNYNGKHLMELFIPSVLAALQTSQIDYEFIVVDDCSTDHSVEFIQQAYPAIILLVNEQNAGFSYTCNQGIRKATKELVFLLNSDVRLTPDYFEAQFSYFDLENTFGVMGRIMNFDEKKIEDAARFPSYKGAKFKANTFYYLENEDSPTLTCYLSGANALVDRQKLRLLNGFNEIYSPFYFEDFDLGLRAWEMGWLLYYEHQSICYHQVSSSTNKVNKSNFVKVTYNRNSFILQYIHLNGPKRFFWLVQLFTITLAGHLIKGEFWIFKSLRQFIAKQKEIKESRRQIRANQIKLNSSIQLNDIIKMIKSSLVKQKIKWL
jgi:GT2 family glycosyltransferase